MLQAVLLDIRAWGGVAAVTTWDGRLPIEPPSAARVVTLTGEEYPTAMFALAEECSAVVLIAPETDGVLEGLTRQLTERGVRLLGSTPEAVAAVADKWTWSERCRQAGLPVPLSVAVPPADVPAAAERLGFPLVLKPRRGAGCMGVCLAASAAEARRALDEPGLRGERSVLVQRFVEGDAVSVSLLVADGATGALGLNAQDVRPGTPFEYVGGTALYAHPRAAEATDLARRAVGLTPGLRGYVGVDLVIGADTISLIEVNARLTTSCVGLRRALSCSLAEALWQTCVDGRVPLGGVGGSPVAFGRGG